MQVNSDGQIIAQIQELSFMHYFVLKKLEWTQVSATLGFFKPTAGAYMNGMIQIAVSGTVFQMKGSFTLPDFQASDKVRIGSGTTTSPSFLGEIIDIQIFVPGALFRIRKKSFKNYF